MPVAAGSGGVGGTGRVEDLLLVTSLGQTIFTLSSAYAAGGYIKVWVNAGRFDKNDDFTIPDGSTTLTWLPHSWDLEPGDEFRVEYDAT